MYAHRTVLHLVSAAMPQGISLMQLRNQFAKHLVYSSAAITVLLVQSTAQSDDPPVREYRYALNHIPGFGGVAERTVALNDAGHVVGWSFLSTGGERPILWDGSSTVDLGTFGGKRGHAYDINNDGVVVGNAQDIDGAYHPFRYEDEALVDIGEGVFWGGDAYGINNAGQICGRAHYIDGPERRPVLWDGDEIINLPTDTEHGGEALSINENGVVVGSAPGDDLFEHAVAWIDGNLIQLNDFLESGAIRSTALAINDHNVAVGQSRNKQSFRASIWNNSRKIQNLSRQENSIGGKIPWIWSVNNSNQMVGSFIARKNDDYYGYVYSEGNGAEALDLLIPPHTGWRIEDGRDINNRGQITGSGFFTDDPNRYARGFLLTPVDPEMELSFADGPLIAGEYNTLTITNATPDATIKFFYGKEGGGTFIPDCDALDAIMQINNPVLFGEAVADAGGNAALKVFVPAKLHGEKGFLFQAANFDNCKESQLVLKQVR